MHKHLLIEFICRLISKKIKERYHSFFFVVVSERSNRSIWFFKTPETHRLTDEDIDEFVNCLKECALISIFNKNHIELAAEACNYLSQLRPQLIVPPLIELFVLISKTKLISIELNEFRFFSSIDNMTEPHRFTSIISCLAGMTRQIVRQTADFPQGQTYVLPILISVLPGIDSNDFWKTSMTFQFLHAMLILITCVDCSSAIQTRNDLTEVKYFLVEMFFLFLKTFFLSTDRKRSLFIYSEIRRFH